jgi:hypothetical protein
MDGGTRQSEGFLGASASRRLAMYLFLIDSCYEEYTVKQSVFLVTIVLLFAFLNAVAPTFAADPAAGVAALKELGAVNGQALACSEMPAAKRAKSLMLGHAPKSQAYGDAFQMSTNDAFLAQSKGDAPCPTTQALAEKLKALETRLNEVLPVTAIVPAPVQ